MPLWKVISGLDVEGTGTIDLDPETVSWNLMSGGRLGKELDPYHKMISLNSILSSIVLIPPLNAMMRVNASLCILKFLKSRATCCSYVVSLIIHENESFPEMPTN
jgi:hypothetical protein